MKYTREEVVPVPNPTAHGVYTAKWLDDSDEPDEAERIEIIDLFWNDERVGEAVKDGDMVDNDGHVVAANNGWLCQIDPYRDIPNGANWHVDNIVGAGVIDAMDFFGVLYASDLESKIAKAEEIIAKLMPLRGELLRQSEFNA